MAFYSGPNPEHQGMWRGGALNGGKANITGVIGGQILFAILLGDGQADPEGSCAGKLLSPSRRRQCVDHIQRELQVSERRACAALGQHRSTQRKAPRGRTDEARLTAESSLWPAPMAATAIGGSRLY